MFDVMHSCMLSSFIELLSDLFLLRSTYWGNDGYILMSAKDNNCGVMTDATYVLM